MKLCIHCRHYERQEYRVTAESKEKYPNLFKDDPVGHLLKTYDVCNQRRDPVRGDVITIDCFQNRNEVDFVRCLACGPEGKFYEQRETNSP